MGCDLNRKCILPYFNATPSGFIDICVFVYNNIIPSGLYHCIRYKIINGHVACINILCESSLYRSRRANTNIENLNQMNAKPRRGEIRLYTISPIEKININFKAFI